MAQPSTQNWKYSATAMFGDMLRIRTLFTGGWLLFESKSAEVVGSINDRVNGVFNFHNPWKLLTGILVTAADALHEQPQA
ncbi:hypothetical protein [Pseudomonas sp. G(2018)]|uniref:hypothetical protein n=1 Tax=Pseudomonas sp. G(2018) TaxID=2502242 RepID=UPI0010F73A23|nr:hypothetical protein [Pseudomonas sp. G(2018)]